MAANGLLTDSEAIRRPREENIEEEDNSCLNIIL